VRRWRESRDGHEHVTDDNDRGTLRRRGGGDRGRGGAVESGPWRIAYIQEPAEGWFRSENGRVVWREPAHGETAHLEIIPIERDSGRIVPYAGVTLEVLDSEGRRVEKRPLSFYYAEFFHHADNFRIPRDGEYTLRATVEPPSSAATATRTAAPPSWRAPRWSSRTS
jgi:hypothetical protein